MAAASKVRSILKDNLLLICLTLAMIIGLILGFTVRGVDPNFGSNRRYVMYLDFPGEILMRMLKMIVMPIIVASMVSGRFS